MRRRHHPGAVEGGGAESPNPLRDFRMSMLGHGFVDEANNEFALDDSDPVAYGLVRMRRGGLTPGVAAAAIVVIVGLALLFLL